MASDPKAPTGLGALSPDQLRAIVLDPEAQAYEDAQRILESEGVAGWQTILDRNREGS